MKKKKQKKTDAAGKYTLPAAGPGWEPPLVDPAQLSHSEMEPNGDKRRAGSRR